MKPEGFRHVASGYRSEVINFISHADDYRRFLDSRLMPDAFCLCFYAILLWGF